MTTLKSIKSVVIDITCIDLLLLVMFLPLIFISISSQLAIKLGIFLFLPTIILIHYFLGKYGSIYKLVFVSLVRNIQFLEEHKDINMALLAGSAMYVVTIYSLLTDLVTSQLPLIKIALGIIIVLLLVYVLPNKKYENAISLIKKILGFSS